MDTSLAEEGAPSRDDPLAQVLPAALPALRTHARHLVRTRGEQEADDLVQETVARALRSRSSFDSERGVLAWLKKIMLHVEIDRRRNAPRNQPTDGLDPLVPDPNESSDTRAWIRGGLAVLKPIEREIIEAFHLREEPLADLARRLQLPEGTVKSHLHRGRRKLADVLRTEAEA